MQIFRGIHHPGLAPSCALTIGNFDGVHRGHQAMLALLQNEARQRGVPSCVMTFEPHPRDFFAGQLNKPEIAPARIAGLRDKLAELQACGIAQCVVLPFNHTLATLSPDDFVKQMCVSPARQCEKPWLKVICVKRRCCWAALMRSLAMWCTVANSGAS